MSEDPEAECFADLKPGSSLFAPAAPEAEVSDEVAAAVAAQADAKGWLPGYMRSVLPTRPVKKQRVRRRRSR